MPGNDDVLKRYTAALHAVQSGVAMTLELGSQETAPKHLRVGVNAAMSDHAALVRLLIAKGILTEEEYLSAIADEMEAEAGRYEERLTKFLGKPIKLG